MALRVCTVAPAPGVFKKVQFPPQRGILFSQLLGEIKLVSFSNRSKVSLAPFPLLLLRLHNFQSSVYARAGSLSPHHLHVLPRHKKRRNQHEDTEPQGNVLGHLVLVSRTKGLLAQAARSPQRMPSWAGHDSDKIWIQEHVPCCVTFTKSLPLPWNTFFSLLSFRDTTFSKPSPVSLLLCHSLRSASFSSEPLDNILPEGPLLGQLLRYDLKNCGFGSTLVE